MKIYKDGLYVEVEETELEVLEETIVNEPTIEERICSLESAIGDLAIMFMGGTNNG